MKHFIFLKSAGIIFFIILLFLQSNVYAKASKQIHLWEPLEIVFKASGKYSNPYAAINQEKKDDLIQVIFTGIKGEAQGKEIAIVGFWDGDNIWKVRFCSPYSGEWKYKSISKDAGLNGKKGNIIVSKWTEEELKSNPCRHGMVKVRKDGTNSGHYFEYTDGTPFLWIGDTWWNWSKSKTSMKRFAKMVDDRAEKGFNIGQLYLSSWGKLIVKPDQTIDIELLQKVDSMIQYANSKGITVFLSPWWGAKELNKSQGEENIKRLERYVVHRFGAYNVIWTLASEYNMWNYGGLGLEFWKNLGAMVDKEDPYERLISYHPTPGGWDAGNDAPQWSTADVMHTEPWLDYNQSQTGHKQSNQEMIPLVVSEAYKKNPTKPIVVTEPWYEFDITQPEDFRQPSPEVIRFGAWTAMLNGAAGHSYGGGHQWLAHTPETPAGKNSYWPVDRNFESNTFDYPGAISMSILGNFFRSIEWRNLEPHPELVKDFPGKYCAAIPGKEYVVYLKNEGYFNLDMSGTTANDQFEYYWLDPANGKKEKSVKVNGGKDLGLSTPSGDSKYRDWVFYMKKV